MKKNYYLVVLIFVVFFAISFLTNILGAINPNVSDSFSLNGTMTGLLPFSFFIAYALMSIPAGMIVQKLDEKKCLVFAWILALAGALVFSLFPSFPVFLGSLFLIGCGMAFLQVIIYPLLRVAGGEQHFAFNSVFAQLVFGAASFLSPFVYAYLVTHLGDPTLAQFTVVALQVQGGDVASYEEHLCIAVGQLQGAPMSVHRDGGDVDRAGESAVHSGGTDPHERGAVGVSAGAGDTQGDRLEVGQPVLADPVIGHDRVVSVGEPVQRAGPLEPLKLRARVRIDTVRVRGTQHTPPAYQGRRDPSNDTNRHCWLLRRL